MLRKDLVHWSGHNWREPTGNNSSSWRLCSQDASWGHAGWTLHNSGAGSHSPRLWGNGAPRVVQHAHQSWHWHNNAVVTGWILTKCVPNQIFCQAPEPTSWLSLNLALQEVQLWTQLSSPQPKSLEQTLAEFLPAQALLLGWWLQPL